MEWRVTTSGSPYNTRGISGILVKPAEGQRPTRKDWEAMRIIVEQAVNKASS